MAFYIVIKNSTTSARPADLEKGELAYSFVAGDSDAGGRLYIGTVDSGVYHTIGGKYYTDMMDHPRGYLTANSAIIVDGDKKINELKVDNFTIDGNTISNDGEADISIQPDTGYHVSVNSSRIKDVSDPIVNSDAATKGYVDDLNTIFILSDDNQSGTGNVQMGGNIDIRGGWNTNTYRNDTVNDSGTPGVDLRVNIDSDLGVLSRVRVDNVTIDGNTVSTSSGNLYLDPDPAGNGGTVIISGSLQVDGTTTTLNSTELTIDDKNITLASGATNATEADSAGISVDGAGAQIFYKASDDAWHSSKKFIAPNLDVTGVISTTSFSGVYLGFDSDFGLKTTDDLPEGDSNLYYRRSKFDSDFAEKTTDDVAEGTTNLYYSSSKADSDARNALGFVDAGGDGSFTYDPSTGEYTYTGPSPAEVRAHFSVTGGMTYDSSIGQFGVDVGLLYTAEQFESDLGTFTTDNLPEGTTNLYMTQERVDSDVRVIIDSGYIRDRQFMNFNYIDSTGVDRMIDSAGLIDSSAVLAMIDSAYIRIRQLSNFNYTDSAQVITLIDEYVHQIVDSDYVFFRQLKNFRYVDSATVERMIDSAGGIDSAAIQKMIDSNDHIDSIGVDQMIDSAIGAFGIDSNSVDQMIDSAIGFLSTNSRPGVHGLLDSNAVDQMIDSAIGAFHIDSNAVDQMIDSAVSKAHIDGLNIDAETVDGNNAAFLLDYPNLTNKPTILDLTDIRNEINGKVDKYYVDKLNVDADTLDSLNSLQFVRSDVNDSISASLHIDSNLTLGGTLRGPELFYIDPSPYDSVAGKVVILGDLQVDGTQTIVNSTTVTINDKNIILADSAADSAEANGAGITVEGANATITYEATGDDWVFNKPIVAPNINVNTITADTITGVYTGFDSDFGTKTTDDLTEGSTNLYYTKTRVDSDFDQSFSEASTDSLSEGLTNLYYTKTRVDSDFDASFSLATTDSLNEGSTNLYYTTDRHDSDFDIRLAIKSTTDLAEGNNLYYTKARADSDIAASLNDSGNTVNITINNTITDTVDSAYVLARIVEASFLDSNDVDQMFDSHISNVLHANAQGFLDSTAVDQMIDSAIGAFHLDSNSVDQMLDSAFGAFTPDTSTFTAHALDSNAVEQMFDSHISNVLHHVASVDSAAVRRILDSDGYLQTGEIAGFDSAAVQNMIDSNLTSYTINALDSTAVDQMFDSHVSNLLHHVASVDSAAVQRMLDSSASNPEATFNVVNNGSSAYTFTGDGFTTGRDNPTLYLTRGLTYRFDINASLHPFEIRSSNGGSAYNTGVVNNTQNLGYLYFTPDMNAPSSLVYQCTIHGGMVGDIVVVDPTAYLDSSEILRIIDSAGYSTTDNVGLDSTAVVQIIDSQVLDVLLSGHVRTTSLGSTNRSTIIGKDAGKNVTTGDDYNTLIGNNVGSSSNITDRNTMIGTNINTSSNNYSAVDTVMIGNTVDHQSGYSEKSVIIGNTATSATNNGVAIGYGATAPKFDGTAVGYLAGDTTLGHEVVIGKQAGGGSGSGTGGYRSIAIGEGAYSGSSVTGNDNITIGTGSGNALTSGSYNTFIGTKSGSFQGSTRIYTGNYNILIGHNAGFDSTGNLIPISETGLLSFGDANIERLWIPGLGLDTKTSYSKDGYSLGWDSTGGNFVWLAPVTGGGLDSTAVDQMFDSHLSNVLHSGGTGSGLDSDPVQRMIDSNLTSYTINALDSNSVDQMLDSAFGAFIPSTNTFLDSTAVDQMIDSHLSNVTHGGSGGGTVDSADIIAIVDSAYVQSRQLNETSAPLTQTNFTITADSNQTLFTHDSQGNAISISDNKFQVYLNGLLLPGDDYTNTASSLTLQVATDSGDVLQIVKFNGNTVNALDSNAVDQMFDSHLSNVLHGGGGGSSVDSASIQRMIDSAAFTGDSADIQRMIDSSIDAGAVPFKQVFFKYIADSVNGLTFSGADDHGNTLSYTEDAIQVFLNGILLLDSADYVATDGTSITLNDSAADKDILTIVKLQGNNIGLDSNAVDQMFDSHISNVLHGGGSSVDSAAIQNMIDSNLTSYTENALDSNTVDQMLDSAFGSFTPDTSNFTEHALDSTAVDQMFDSHQSNVLHLDSAAVVSLITGSDLDMQGNKVLFANVYDSTGLFPSATTYHGMFAHAHNTGAGYFAHAGNWVRLANYTDIGLDSNAVDQMIDSHMTNVAHGGTGGGLDSNAIEQMLDSHEANTTHGGSGTGGVDSDAVKLIVDSDYIGSKVDFTRGEFATNRFQYTATSGQTVFSHSAIDPNHLDVYINGVLQVVNDVYTTSGTAVTFTTGVDSGYSVSIIERRGRILTQRGLNETKYYFTTASPTTSITGADDNSRTLDYSDGLTDVYLNGMLLKDSDDYSTNSGTTITLISATDSNDLVTIVNRRGVLVSPNVKNYEYTATAGQLTFSGEDINGNTLGYANGAIQVHLNGILLRNADYTATTGTSIVLNDSAALNDELVVSAFSNPGQNMDLYKFVADSGQTQFSGNDVTGASLAYQPGNIQVFLNGLLMNDSDDYIASNGMSVVFNEAVNSLDEVKIASFVNNKDNLRTNAWTAPTGTVSANAGDKLFIDTSSGARTVILPSSASMGDEIRIVDVTGNAATNNITVDRNGHNIQGSASDLTININRAGIGLVYYNSAQGWVLIEN